MKLQEALVALDRRTPAGVLLGEMDYLARVMQVRLALHVGRETSFERPEDVPRLFA